jgi:hypothetical protein
VDWADIGNATSISRLLGTASKMVALFSSLSSILRDKLRLSTLKDDVVANVNAAQNEKLSEQNQQRHFVAVCSPVCAFGRSLNPIVISVFWPREIIEWE